MEEEGGRFRWNGGNGTQSHRWNGPPELGRKAQELRNRPRQRSPGQSMRVRRGFFAIVQNPWGPRRQSRTLQEEESRSVEESLATVFTSDGLI